ncbi:triacylglycerol esterase/lipase EstA (alpha/beta hydrolase family) [Catenulispora sp. GAS73]|uniref:esterase/lipase family protein n=1 Tax=Catenulispora sp. GAS73 TaxID=3156269 RepID=UPI00351957F3
MRPVFPRPRTLRRPLRQRAARLLAAALLAGPATLAAAPAHAAEAPAFSSGVNDFSCQPSAEHPRPLVLLHGTFLNPTEQWLLGGPYFAHLGYCVFELDYGQYAGIPLVHGIAPIEQSGLQLAAYVDRVLAATGAGQVDILGHSQGGGALPRYYLKFLGGAPKVHALVGIAPTNHGGTASGLFTVAQQIPGATRVIGTACPACVEQFVGSAFNRRLDAGGDTVPGVRYTTIVSRFDELVTPYTNQFLAGPNVHNVLVQDLCPLDVSDHVLIGTVDGVAFHEAANALDPAHATPTTCADLVTGVVRSLI